MATKFGTLNCSTTAGGNIARPDCEFKPGLHIGSIFLRDGDVFASADVDSSAAFKAALVAKLQADSPGDRAYIVGRYRAWNPTGEAAQDQTFDDGTKVRTREGTVAYEMTLIEGKWYHKAVKETLHNQSSGFDEVLIFDQGDGTYVAYGANRESSTPGDYDMGGFGLDNLTVSSYSRRTGSAIGQFTLGIGYTDAIDLDTNFFLLQLDFNPLNEVDGLTSVSISASSTGPTNITVKGAIPGSGPLAAKFGSDLAVAGAWVATNEEPGDANEGNTITISTVTLSGENYVATTAATGTDPDNPGTGKRVGIRLAAPSALAALTTPVLGIESNKALTDLG